MSLFATKLKDSFSITIVIFLSVHPIFFFSIVSFFHRPFIASQSISQLQVNFFFVRGANPTPTATSLPVRPVTVSPSALQLFCLSDLQLSRRPPCNCNSNLTSLRPRSFLRKPIVCPVSSFTIDFISFRTESLLLSSLFLPVLVANPLHNEVFEYVSWKEVSATFIIVMSLFFPMHSITKNILCRSINLSISRGYSR
ncbi:unnamed protein product [Acanthosepion pharaonis]|uniref:Uncharacterized protein n=1 Tax=Acanthosepion pharaonis TaxID=158019 RepID=A0A812ATL1_ACAPH|nr:unnamed protein product [Sepia pharaonis]